ncbi:hypothetical protein YC2023_009122 [Brassica napus]
MKKYNYRRKRGAEREKRENYESVNKVDAAALTCTRLPNSNWCCNTTPRRCRGSKVECDAISLAAISKTAFAKNLWQPRPLPSKLLVIGMLGKALIPERASKCLERAH